MKMPIAKVICIIGLSLTTFIIGCKVESTPPIGKNCTVQFRLDALGVSTDILTEPRTRLPMTMFSDRINNLQISLKGTLKSANDDWVVVDSNGSEIWIPTKVILLIKY
jgi:hypothetical protein